MSAEILGGAGGAAVAAPPAPAVQRELSAAAGSAQAAQILCDWSGLPFDSQLARGELLHEIFHATADAHGNRIAVECGDVRLTYAQIDERSNRLAHLLRARGAGRGSFVAMLLPRGPDVYVALLAILKAGAAYVPLDPSYPADRIAYILGDCGVHTLITTSDKLPLPPVLRGDEGRSERGAAARNDEIRTTNDESNSNDPMTNPGPQSDSDIRHSNIDSSFRAAAPPSTGGEGERQTAAIGIVLLDRDGQLIAAQPSSRIGRDVTSTVPADLAYVIYTSGSTGRPKGVMIEHRAAANLVRAEARLFGVVPADRVYQGFSIAFDASVEEVWLAFQSGAALVAGTEQMVHAGPALSRMLADAAVTVLSCVPTLLAMMDQDAPTVRLLILGGEACPQDLARRWCRPGRRVVNTYGPTEATVIATYADLVPAEPVTIGRPVPNYRVYILDEQVRPVPVGEVGELHIGGIGLARGYVGRPDLTAERFIRNRFAELHTDPHAARLYKTGDLARWTADGRIEFMGRADTQVKLRGFRIELAEIESALMQHPAVQSAVVMVREDAPGVQQLVGYVICKSSSTFDEDAAKRDLRTHLPAYMVPAILEPIDRFPTLPSSGKVDRKQLPAPRPRETAIAATEARFTGPLEQQLGEAWRSLFSPQPVGRDDNFFTDLGGHSLLAATVVSRLRRTGGAAFRDLSVLDVYNHPTIARLAAELEERRPRESDSTQTTAPAAATATGARTSSLVHALCAVAQVPGLYIVVGLFATQWLAPYLIYCWMLDQGTTVTRAILCALGVILLLYPTMLLVGVAAKWLIIGRYKPGMHRVWGFYYWRWWLVNRILAVAPIEYLEGTPLLGLYYRLLGARVGRNVHLHTDNVRAFDLVEIGDDSSIGADVSLAGYAIEDGWLKLGRIRIGRRCYVGARGNLRMGTVMEDDARLEDLSLLCDGSRIPAGQTWAGSPARPRADQSRDTIAAAAPLRPPAVVAFAHGLIQSIGSALIPIAYLVAIFPGLMWMGHLGLTSAAYRSLFVIPVVALSFVVLLGMEIVLVKWLLLGRVRPGTYPVHSGFYLRKWFVDRLMDLSLDILGPLYATLYLNPWYRLLGAKLGHRAEISTACSASPDLLEIGDESFVADCVSLGAPRVERGTITVLPTRIGKRAFVGNSAVVPCGATIGDNALVGVLTMTPAGPQGAQQPDTSWLGSPAIFLPQRLVNTAFAAEATFKPTRWLVAQRLFIEYFRITLPPTLFVFLSANMITLFTFLRDQWGTASLVATFPLIYALFGLAAAAIVIVAKWLLMDEYEPGEQPLWSHFVWRTELLTALHEHLADPFLVELLEGTPWVCTFFRLMGCNIGKRVCLETTSLTEFDLITIGDDAAIAGEATLQTHLFEDRVMKMGTVRIGNGCSVGASAVVLYDTQMGDGSVLGEVSLLMKGESLPPDTRWSGTPARRE